MAMLNDPHGVANYKDGVLKITTTGKGKTKPKTVEYKVTVIPADPKVAWPAYSLKKEGDGGESYHVGVEEHGPTCSCPHYVFRGSNSRACCKHVAALRAVGLLPKATSP